MNAYSILKSGKCTCVLTNGRDVYTSNLRGVKPLLDFIDSGSDFSGFSAADKVVGKGAALLYVLLGVKSVYADILSIPAKKVLDDNGIEVKYGILVEAIINRKCDGFCPVETAVRDVNNPKKALPIIIDTLKKLN